MDLTRQLIAAVKVQDECHLNGDKLNDMIALVKSIKAEHEQTSLVPIQKSLDELHTQRKVFQQFVEDVVKMREEKAQIAVIVEAESKQLSNGEEYIQLREMFQLCCGLDFKITDDNAISLTFSNVDPNDPSRQFSVTLDLKNDGDLTSSSLWALVNAEPNIEELPQLITQLNKTNNFHMFCEQLRKLFQLMYTSQ